MPKEVNPQLTEDDEIERKTRLFRLISRILIGVSIVVIGIFIVFAFGTKQNISLQTALDTQELRSKLTQLVSLEIKHHKENGEYVKINYLSISKEIPNYDAAIDGKYKYKFDPETGIATGSEMDASNDVNGDNDGNDGLTLSVDWEYGVIEGSRGGNFFWTDADKSKFDIRAGKTQ